MERSALLLRALLAALSLTMPVLSAAPAELFVATNGSDANVGSREKPFATLTRARDAIRQVRAQDGLPQGVVVQSAAKFSADLVVIPKMVPRSRGHELVPAEKLAVNLMHRLRCPLLVL